MPCLFAMSKHVAELLIFAKEVVKHERECC